jgi:hypothetical protein
MSINTENDPFASSDKSTFGQSPDLPKTSPPPATDKQPAAELMDKVVQGAHDTIDRLADSAAPQVERLDEGVAAAGDALHENADRLRETGEQWAESLRSTIRDNPLATVLAALALGMVIARLTR